MAKQTSSSSGASAVATPSARKTTAKANPQSRNSPQATPDAEAIRFRAYEIYLSRGQAGGSALEDWLQAERELISPPSQKRVPVTSR